MENVLKALIIVIVAIYVLSPIDAMPGPVDDIIVAILGVMANNGLSKK